MSRKSLSKQVLAIPDKANQVLYFILLVCLLLLFRSWYLSVIQHDAYMEKASAPQRRVRLEKAKRGNITDRFGKSLVGNRIQYNASILYAQIKDLPRVARRFRKGKWERHYPRKEHVKRLSLFLARELNLEAFEVEDLIYAKAALFPNTSFTLKESITEKQYYKLKALEKNYPGLVAEELGKREYIHNKLACHILGYLGSINAEEYKSKVRQKQELKLKIQELQNKAHLQDFAAAQTLQALQYQLDALHLKSYRINDFLGKSGVEKSFENVLRGYYGKRIFHADAKGNFLRELSGRRKAIGGMELRLSISKDLQEYAEDLLVHAEEIRQGRSQTFDFDKKRYLNLKQPPIKGGAIVVMDPNNGEILALASHPKYDPNDFIFSGNIEKDRLKTHQIRRWFEGRSHIANLWNGTSSLEQEYFSSFSKKSFVEEKTLTWTQYLKLILPKNNAVYVAIQSMKSLEEYLQLQETFFSLLHIYEKLDAKQLMNLLYSSKHEYSGNFHVECKSKAIAWNEWTEEEKKQLQLDVDQTRKALHRYFHQVLWNEDKLLLIDLTRLLADQELFSQELRLYCKSQSAFEYRKACQSMHILLPWLKTKLFELFSTQHFPKWRKTQQSAFLKRKREDERKRSSYARPYTDYLDEEKQRLFHTLWSSHEMEYLSLLVYGHGFLQEEKYGYQDQEVSAWKKDFQEHCIQWQKEVMQGAHRHAFWHASHEHLYHMAQNWPKDIQKTYLATLRSFKDLSKPLLSSYKNVWKESRQSKDKSLQDLAASFYPRFGYGFARSYAFRQSTPQGSIFKLIVAYEALIQRVQELEEKVENLNPLSLIDKVESVGHRGKRLVVAYRPSGEAIYRMYKGGRLPRSDRRNNGLLDISKAIEVSSNPYFSLLASEVISKPEDLNDAALAFGLGKKTGIQLPGEFSGNLPNDLDRNQTGLYSYAIGQHTLVVTPLQTAVMMSALVNGGKVIEPSIMKEIRGESPQQKQQFFLQGKAQVFAQAFAPFAIDFPLFSSAEVPQGSAVVQTFPKNLRHQVYFPKKVQKLLKDSMRRVILGKNASASPSSCRFYSKDPYYIRDYEDLKHEMIGKTSTAEIVEAVDLDREMGSYRYKHVGFAAASYEGKDWQNQESPAELVVVVFLRFGNYGKEAAPIAAQMIKKWREIKRKYES